MDGSTDRRLSTRPRPHLISEESQPGDSVSDEYGGRGGNRTPICWLQASGPTVERLPHSKSGARGGGRNPNLRFTKAALCHLSYSGVELGADAENRTLLVGLAVRCQANWRHPRKLGADGDNRNLFSGVEAQGTPYIPRPQCHIFNCQRPERTALTHFDPHAYHGKQVRPFLM